MKKGEIYYFDKKFRENHQGLEDKKHPIVCLRDTENPSFFHAVILSHGEEPKGSPIINYKLDISEFDSDSKYSVPGTFKEEWLVGMGLWKDAKGFPEEISGKVSLKGLNSILLKLIEISSLPRAKKIYAELSEKKNELDDEKFYHELISVIEKCVIFEEVKTELEDHIKNIKP